MTAAESHRYGDLDLTVRASGWGCSINQCCRSAHGDVILRDAPHATSAAVAGCSFRQLRAVRRGGVLHIVLLAYLILIGVACYWLFPSAFAI